MSNEGGQPTTRLLSGPESIRISYRIPFADHIWIVANFFIGRVLEGHLEPTIMSPFSSLKTMDTGRYFLRSLTARSLMFKCFLNSVQLS